MVAVTVLSLLLLLSLGLEVAGYSLTEEDYPHPTKAIGLSLPSYGDIYYNDRGRIEKLIGFNLGLGYSWRKYIDGGVQMGEFNGYWGWGTFALFLPYLEFGATYATPIGEKNDDVLAFEVGAIYLVPRISVALWF